MSFTDDERERLNRASAMLKLAQRNLEDVWTPIRKRYRLPVEIIYDRETGEVRDG